MIAGFNIKTIDDVEISNKRVLLKVDFNILNLHDGKSLLDTKKVDYSIPSIEYLSTLHNRIICVSHVSKTKGRDPKRSLKPIAQYLQTLLPKLKVVFINDFLNPSDLKRIRNQISNEIILLENIRFYEGEAKNDPEFVKKLVELADVYVNDAFPADHRAYASVVGPQKYLPSYAGFQLKKEVETILSAVENPKQPLVVIIGGSKISTKINLIKTLLGKSDYLLLGGALANTFFKAQGYEIGASLYEPDELKTASELLELAKIKKANLVLPQDVILGSTEDDSIVVIDKKLDAIQNSTLSILDIGPKSRDQYAQIIAKSKTIIWNGPVGYFEKSTFQKGTEAIYDAIINNKYAISIVGGGDTLTAIDKKQGKEKITHISIGGGAMLKLIENGTLPALEALQLAQGKR